MVEIHVYDARITGYNFFTSSFSEEDILITWPCTKTTELTKPNLFDIGKAIGEHAIECGVCTDGRTRGT